MILKILIAVLALTVSIASFAAKGPLVQVGDKVYLNPAFRKLLARGGFTKDHLIKGNKIRLSSEFGKLMVRDTAGFLCHECISGFFSPADIEQLHDQTNKLMRSNPNLVNMYYQLLFAASNNQQLADRHFADFAQSASKKLYRPLQKLTSPLPFERDSLTLLIDYKARGLYNKNRIISLAQGQRVSDILTTIAEQSKNHGQASAIDLMALRSIIDDFASYQQFESQLPDEDAAQILAIAKDRVIDRNLITELLTKINEREELIAELGIALHNVLKAHKVDVSRLEAMATSLFSSQSNPVIVANVDPSEMTKLGLLDGQQGQLGEYLQHLRGKEVMLIKRLNDQLQVEVISITDDGMATTISNNNIDGNTLFKDNQITLTEVFNHQQQLPFNLTNDVPFPATWHELIVEKPTHHYLQAELTLAMGWGEADAESLFADENIIELLEKERNYHLDNPAKLAVIDSFISSYPKAVKRLETVSAIDQIMGEQQWTLNEQPSPYLDDLSPSQLLTVVKEEIFYHELLYVAELPLLESLSKIDDWYWQSNLGQLVKILQKDQQIEYLTTMPSYQKLVAEQSFGYRDYLQLQMELEDLLRKLPPSHDLYLAVVMLPQALKIEQLVKELTKGSNLAKLSDPLFRTIETQITAGEVPIEQLQVNLQKIVDSNKQRQLPPALIHDQPAEITYVQPHWLPKTSVYRQPSSVVDREGVSSKEPGVISLQALSDDLSPYDRLEAINKVLDLDFDKLITKMNKIHKRTGQRRSSFDQLTINELLNKQNLAKKDLQIANRYLQVIEEVYQRQIPNLNFSKTTNRHQGRDQYVQEIGRQLQLVREELRRRVTSQRR